jgi:hypothetical protein
LAAQEEIDRLQRRLNWESAGPLTDLSNRTAAALFSLLRALARWVRQSGEERPLISLLLAFEAGFAVGRLGSWRAKR